MSKIIGARDHLAPRPPRGKDGVTLDQAANVALMTAGPIAIATRELIQKVARIEDILGLTDASVLDESYEKLKGWRRWLVRKLVGPLKSAVPVDESTAIPVADMLQRQREAIGGDLE